MSSSKITTSVINVTLKNIQPLKIPGNIAAYPMSRFKEVLTDKQIADVLTFIRATWNNHAPMASEPEVAALRRATSTGDVKGKTDGKAKGQDKASPPRD